MTDNPKTMTAEELADSVLFDRGPSHHEDDEVHGSYCVECGTCQECAEKEIVKALKAFADQARKEGYAEGMEEAQFIHCCSGAWQRGFERARKMAVNLCYNAPASTDPIELAFSIRALQPPIDGDSKPSTINQPSREGAER